MCGDPFYRWLHPDDERRGRWMVAFMGRLLSLLWPRGAVYGEGERGVIGLLPPGAPSHPLDAQARFVWGTLTAPEGPGVRRLWQGARALHRLEAHRPEAPHWYVVIAGVAPAGQGAGLGRALMEHACGLAAADGVPLYLETTNPDNVAFYQRFGLDVTAEVPLGPQRPAAWTMIRAPGGRSSLSR